jgi:hypothetical protein
MNILHQFPKVAIFKKASNLFPIEGVSLSRNMFFTLQSTLYKHEHKMSSAHDSADIRGIAVD